MADNDQDEKVPLHVRANGLVHEVIDELYSSSAMVIDTACGSTVRYPHGTDWECSDPVTCFECLSHSGDNVAAVRVLTVLKP